MLTYTNNEPVLTQPTQQTLDTIQDFLCELGMRVHTVNYNMSRFTLAKTETQVGSPAVRLRLARCTAWVKQWSEAMDFLLIMSLY